MKQLDVAIIGAGTSGLSAASIVKKHTQNYAIFHDGPHGTTCARVGCMPSKVLIQVANDYHQVSKLEKTGVHGFKKLEVNTKEVMTHVRSLRDRFVRSVLSGVDNHGDKVINERVKFCGPNLLETTSGVKYQAKKIIIATGSSPIIPNPWKEFGEHLVTTDQFFEMESLPKSMAVIGLGVIGIELGQALHRLGVKVVGFDMTESLGGLTDPDLKKYTVKKFKEEMELHFGPANIVGYENGKLKIESNSKIFEVEKALISIGRAPNINKLRLETTGAKLDEKSMPSFDRSTMQIENLPIFIAGDVNSFRPILHEAADEGRMAGFNSVLEQPKCFKRRAMLGITFSDPNIALVGKRYQELVEEKTEFVTGKVSFEGQGRSIVKLKEIGLLHIYANKKDGKLLGAEMFGPDNEHLAHLIAWAIQLNLSLDDMLKLPFYHPVVEEGLRTAIRDASSKTDSKNSDIEMSFCQDPPAGTHV